MVEAIVEKTSEYYNNYQEHFRYVIAFSKPATENLVSQNNAFGLHAEEQDVFCSIRESLYHFLTGVDTKKTSKFTDILYRACVHRIFIYS